METQSSMTSASTPSQTQLQELCSKLLLGGRLNSRERRALSRHPAWFARIYLRDDDGMPLVPAPHHWEWYDLYLGMLSGSLRHAAILAPKGHAKSTIFSKVIPLHLICVVDRNVRIVGGSVNSELAEQFLLAIRRELERNELLIEDYGPFREEAEEKWTQTRFIVQRSSSSQSPTYRAVGSEKPVQGGRSDWIIGDDLADIANSTTQRGRDRLEAWVDGDLMGTLEPDGHAILVGTAKHHDDLLHRREQRAKAPDSGWVFRRYDAIVDEEQRIALWPARWSFQKLMEKRDDIRTLAFNRDYRNIAVDDETSLFPLAMLEAAKNPDLTFTEYYGREISETDTVTAGIDLAIVEDERDAQRTDGDYTVIQVWRRMANGKRRLLWGERRRGYDFPAQTRLAEATLRRYAGALKICIVEANQAQRWFASSLLMQARGELPIAKHVTGRGVRVDIYEGIPSLQALFEAGMIELPYGDERSRAFVDVFVNELHGLGVEAHDDAVMSFWLNEIGMRKLTAGSGLYLRKAASH